MARRLIGIGNPDRGDDAAGWEVAAKVAAWSVERRIAGSFDMLEMWDEDDEVVIVDAMRSGAPPGTVHRFDALADRLPVGAFSSTHAFGPAAVIELARTMDRLPRSLVVYGIEAGQVGHGTAMSPAVATAVSEVAKELEDA
ncbi:MAG: hydrogenase maturation protease [Gammaproteobacteria bacterium]|nr:hydrogenase maturation protease [Gammaproteobacteria bacterium]